MAEEQVKSMAKWFALGDWGLGGCYVWCLVIVVIFMGLREAKMWVREALKSSCVWRR